jgi:UDP-N-acetyl-D-galactosamine dehydrogenase
VNIALINELAVLFGKLDIDTHDVLEAAGTKWNFLAFTPGLVGGHCIGVDPYYLTHKAQEVGHHSEVILAGRRINDGMGPLIADRVVQLMGSRGRLSPSSRVLVLGLAFKENCPDIRNTRVTDIIGQLGDVGITVDVVDPWVGPAEAKKEYDLNLLPLEATLATSYDAVILAVAHEQFMDLAQGFRARLGSDVVLYDVKGKWPRELVDGRL